MKISTILSVLLPTTLALPLAVPASPKADVTTRDIVAKLDGPLLDQRGTGVGFPVKYAKDVIQTSRKREKMPGFPVRYKKDLIDENL